MIESLSHNPKFRPIEGTIALIGDLARKGRTIKLQALFNIPAYK